jgi:glycosyltransferase involved in cell wall biosynthesis
LLVSILIPAFNSQDWIAATIRSAISQTWEPKEIIVVDDGSTDNTLAIARRFEPAGVRVFPQTNQGAAAARNTAYSHCRGEYIQWLDADDILAADKIATQMQAIRPSTGKRVLLSSAWGRFFHRHQRAKFIPTALWRDLSPTEWLLRKMGDNLFMQTASWLVSRELTEAAGPWDKALLADDDGEYFCRVLLQSEWVQFVPEAKVYYRARGAGSLSYIGLSSAKVEPQWRSMQMHVAYLRSMEESERIRAACVKYLQTSLIYFYPERPDIVEQAQRVAKELGAKLDVPRLPWKYSWIVALLGYRMAKRIWLRLRQVKRSLMIYFDKALLHIENLIPVRTAK